MCNVKKKGSTLRNGVCFESVKMKEMDDMLIFLWALSIKLLNKEKLYLAMLGK